MKGDSKVIKVIKIITFEDMSKEDIIISELNKKDTLEYFDSININLLNNKIKFKKYKEFE